MLIINKINFVQFYTVKNVVCYVLRVFHVPSVIKNKNFSKMVEMGFSDHDNKIPIHSYCKFLKDELI